MFNQFYFKAIKFHYYIYFPCLLEFNQIIIFSLDFIIFHDLINYLDYQFNFINLLFMLEVNFLVILKVLLIYRFRPAKPLFNQISCLIFLFYHFNCLYFTIADSLINLIIINLIIKQFPDHILINYFF